MLITTWHQVEAKTAVLRVTFPSVKTTFCHTKFSSVQCSYALTIPLKNVYEMSYRAFEHSVVFIIPNSPSEMLMHTIEWLLILNCVLLLPKTWELVRFQADFRGVA